MCGWIGIDFPMPLSNTTGAATIPAASGIMLFEFQVNPCFNQLVLKREVGIQFDLMHVCPPFHFHFNIRAMDFGVLGCLNISSDDRELGVFEYTGKIYSGCNIMHIIFLALFFCGIG